MTLKELEKRLKKEPDNLGLRVQVAGLMREAGRSTEAVELYRSVALAYRDQGRTQQAVAVCKAILEIAPDDERCIALLSTLQGRSTPSIPSIAPPATAAPLRAPPGPSQPPAVSLRAPAGPSQPPPSSARAATAQPPPAPSRAPTPSQPPSSTGQLPLPPARVPAGPSQPPPTVAPFRGSPPPSARMPAGPSQPPPTSSQPPKTSSQPPATGSQPPKTSSQPPKTSSRPPAVVTIPPKSAPVTIPPRIGGPARAASEGTPAPAPSRPPTEPAPPSPVTARLPLEPPTRKTPSAPPADEPKRRSSLEETPLPKPVPHHIHDPTGKGARVDPEDLDTNPHAEPKRTKSGTGLAEAARKISDKMKAADEDVSRPLDTRPVRRITNAELEKLQQPPPTVEHERVSDDSITASGEDEELTTPHDRIDLDD